MTAANLPQEARALLDAIAQGESDPVAKHEGISPYFILYGGGSFEGYPDRPGYYGFPAWSGKDNSHAAGRYQFQPGTWRDIVPHFGKSMPNFRNPGDQDWGAWFLAQHDYQTRTGVRLIVALRAGATENIGGILQPTWTSMSDGTFPGRYTAALAKYPSGPVMPAKPPAPIWTPAKPSAAPAPPPAPVWTPAKPSAPPISGASPVIAAKAMTITIETIPHTEQRIPGQAGDWQLKDSEITIRVSALGNWRYEAAVVVRELVEVLLCMGAVPPVTQPMADRFDLTHLGHAEYDPGDDPKAPYRNQHCFATAVERMLVAALGVSWADYRQTVEGL